MIMTYDENATNAVERVDMSANIIKSVTARDSHHGMMGNLKSSSGKTAEFEIPDPAPLVFPQLDSLPNAKKEGKMQSGMSFLSDYFDRRSQASWEAQHPGSALNVAPRKDFGGRFADPTSAASKGSIFSPSTYTSGGAGGDSTGRRRRQRGQRGGIRKLLSEVSSI